ncbi:MAG: hypothetical protein LBK28_03525 [Propionibacteriaceae bacterium]|nr:hypothetical protein [Propionibacteriaceae bacterium]
MNKRREDAARRAALAASTERAEAVAAQAQIDGFVATAKDRGLVPEPLRAITLAGKTVRTDRVGWYLNAARSVAVGADGSFYRLVVPGSFRDRFRGVELQTSAPPLVIGLGARDGESGDLAGFLAAALEAYAPR